MVRKISITIKINTYSSRSSFAHLFLEHGHVYSWGLGVFGQLGHGSLDDLRQPKRIEHLVKLGVVVVQVVCGAYHTVARTCTFCSLPL